MILDLFIYIIQFYINQNTFLPGFIIRKELEMYQKMMDKGFGIKAIASIFSVSEESIERLLMKA